MKLENEEGVFYNTGLFHVRIIDWSFGDKVRVRRIKWYFLA